MSAVTFTAGHGLEIFQNSKNSLTAARNRFFARKIHKLKKMLRPLFSRHARRASQPEPPVIPRDYSEVQVEDEEAQNAMNEALEARLAEDLANSSGVSGEAIRALEDGQVTLVVVNPGASIPVPASFFTPTPGRFSWTFLPTADHDICARGDFNALSLSQIPEQQTPPASPR